MYLVDLPTWKRRIRSIERGATDLSEVDSLSEGERQEEKDIARRESERER
jgi:hypothetical protein